MANNITIEGLEELQQQLKGLKWMSTYMGPARAKAGRLVKAAIKSEAPIKSGKLKESIKINPGRLNKRSKGVVLVAVDYDVAPHAHLVEFGARDGAMKENAFFTRGFLKSKDAAMKELQAGAMKAVDQAIK